MDHTSAELTLPDVRAHIDAIDQKIVSLIAERQRWVVAAGRLKSTESDVRAPDRAQRVIARVRDLAEGAGAAPDVVEGAYRALIAGLIEFELDDHRRRTGSLRDTE